ncbi:MAG: ABC transporter permease [Anaerolineae bacterium]|jgi:peptide/nickel transport system permease protein|nr:ABC transporter permease [Anaerolineae bacterium]
MKARALAYLVTLWAVLTLNFFLPRLLPGDPIGALLDPQSSGYVFDAEVRAELEAYYGLDRPVPVQYAAYLWGIATGDLGHSIRLNRPVTALLAAHLPWTLLLTGTALGLASLLGLLGGAEAAWKRGSAADRLLTAASVVAGNAPVYFVGMMLLILFGARLGWLPLAGGRTPFADYSDPWAAVADVGKHLVLPALTLTLSLLGVQFLLVRNHVVGILGEDFMLVARAKGLRPARLKWGHAVRNALLPFVAHLAAHAGLAITGAVFIETLFQYPGMGRLIFESVGARDYPVIQGVFLAVAVVVLTANLLADWVNSRLDPRLAEEVGR